MTLIKPNPRFVHLNGDPINASLWRRVSGSASTKVMGLTMGFNILATVATNAFSPAEGLVFIASAIGGYGLSEFVGRGFTNICLLKYFNGATKYLDRIPDKTTPPTSPEDYERARDFYQTGLYYGGSLLAIVALMPTLNGKPGAENLFNELYNIVCHPQTKSWKDNLSTYFLLGFYVHAYAAAARFNRVTKGRYEIVDTPRPDPEPEPARDKNLAARPALTMT